MGLTTECRRQRNGYRSIDNTQSEAQRKSVEKNGQSSVTYGTMSKGLIYV